MKGLTVEIARDFLKEKGYFTDMLWHVGDVKQQFECDDNKAQIILNDALTNEWMMEQCFETIRELSKIVGLKENKFICGSCGERCAEYTYDEDKDIDVGNCCK
jgi:hypothetical protein